MDAARNDVSGRVSIRPLIVVFVVVALVVIALAWSQGALMSTATPAEVHGTSVEDSLSRVSGYVAATA